jgi:translation elongation factor EF-Tu-like GTPase
MAETEVAIVTHYFSHLGVAAIRMTAGELKVGDQVHIKGHTSDFLTAVTSMQTEHHAVHEAKSGDSIGIRIEGHAREHDKIYKVTA